MRESDVIENHAAMLEGHAKWNEYSVEMRKSGKKYYAYVLFAYRVFRLAHISTHSNFQA